MSKLHIEKLTGPDNWTSWSIQIQDILRFKGLIKHIKRDPPTKYLTSASSGATTPDITKPTEPAADDSSKAASKKPAAPAGDDEESEAASDYDEGLDSDDEPNLTPLYIKWAKKDIEALLYIRGSLAKDPLESVRDAVTAKEAWGIIKEAHDYVTPDSIVNLMAKFWTIKYADDQPMVDHYRTLSQLYHDINAIEEGAIPPRNLGIAMLASLPEDSWGTIIQTLDKGAKDYDGPEGKGPAAWERMVHIRLFDEYQRRKNAENNSAMSAFKGKWKGKGAQTKGSGPSKSEKDKKPGKCHNCGKKGHWKNECRGPKKEDTKDAKKPDTANTAVEEIKSPEIATLSVKSQPSSQPCLTSYPSTVPSNGGSSMLGVRNKMRQRSKGYRGYNYKEIKRPCPKTDWDDDDMHLDLCDIYGDEIYDNLDYYSVGELCYVLTGSSSKWFLDSGATTHVVMDRSLLENFRPCREDLTGVGGKTAILGRGDATLLMEIKGKQIPIKLKDCAYVPTASNLISIPKICDGDGRVIFEKQEALCYNKQGALFCVGRKIKRGLYEVNPTSPLTASKGHPQQAYLAKPKARSWQEWHSALGHISLPSLQTLQKHNPTMVVRDPDNTKYTCAPCDMAKATKTPQAKSIADGGHTVNIQRPGDQILMDTMGPITPLGKGNMKYAVQNIDNKTRFHVCTPTTDKTQALKAFKQMETTLELADSSYRVRSTFSDQGTEFKNDEFKTYTSEKGIIMNFAAPYSPATMGMIERTNRTLAEMVRTMLLESGLPKNLWPHLIIHAVWIKNRVPHAALKGKTPYEELYHEIPDLSRVPRIGASIYVLDQTGKPKKLDAKAAPFPFIGFDGSDKTAKYYHSPTRTVRTTRNWKFVPDDESGGESDRENGDSTPATPTLHQDDDQIEFEDGPDEPDELEDHEPSGNQNEQGEDPIPEPQNDQIPDSGGDNDDNVPGLIQSDDDIPEDDNEPDEEEDQPPPPVTPPRAPTRPRTPPTPVKKVAGQRRSARNKPPINYKEADGGDLRKKPVNQNPESKWRGFTVVTDDNGEEVYLGKPQEFRMEDVLEGPESEQWQKAMDEEYSSLIKNETFSAINLPSDRKAIGCRWVLTKKHNNDGEVIQYKARLVAQGFSQRPGWDYMETYAPVVRFDTWRLALGIAVQEDMDVHVVDAKSAYLQATLKEEIYMKQIPRYNDGTNRVLRLHKSIYGLKQAGNEWNKLFDQKIQSIGYTRCETDPCAYWKHTKDYFSMLLIHVDDSMIVTTKGFIEEAKNELKAIVEMKDLGEIERYLGIKVERDRIAGTIKISQPSYIKDIIEKAGMTGCNSVSTPMDRNLSLVATEEPQSDPKYANLIGMLMWASISTRPDISYATSLLARFTHANGPEHLTAVKHVFRYLSGTIDHGITYRKSDTPEDPVMYTDSDYAGDRQDRRSISGYVSIFAEGAFSWSSTRQSTVALSTMEAEYIASANSIRQVRWYQQFLEELGFGDTSGYKVLIDNRAAKSLGENPQTTSKSKHIDIVYHYARRCLQKGLLSFSDVPTESNLADLFTKALPRGTFLGLKAITMG